VDPVVCVVALGVAVCLIGVPHGGLDSLTGRQWLAPLMGNYWSCVFFSGYLAIAALIVLGWIAAPLWTAILFFLVSAWHFGWEDDDSRSRTRVWSHLTAVASGGLVIWIPALFRPLEMRRLLEWIVPSSMSTSGGEIVAVTMVLCWIFLPIAIADFGLSVANMVSRKLSPEPKLARNLLLVVLFASTPILFSFGLYFCGWHSIRGLAQLQKEHRMSSRELFFAVLPLSLGAIGMAGAATWFWSSGRELSAELSRSLFIGLSAIAVPHLLLHGVVGTLPRIEAEDIDLARGLIR
jgi:Brp/Blh family beta-carotene 15,15'-monooxygenase